MAQTQLDRARHTDGDADLHAPAPGRRTRTEDLPPSNPLHATAAASIQMMRATAPTAPALGTVQLQRMVEEAVRPDLHAGAADAIAGGAGPLPFGDTIQASFGRHDIGGIQAHTDATAMTATRAMGAAAFAFGDHVAFGRTPDLHTAAHEAAHVVQQRGGVQCKGGVGAEGDAYEQHADHVADAVVSGRSAEALLDRFASSVRPAQLAGGTAPALQAIWLEHRGTPYLRWDPTVDGLRWYLDERTGLSFFQIETDPGLSDPQLTRLESLEGPGKMRTIDAWCRTPLFEPSQSTEPATVAASAQDLGPTTARGVPIARVGFGTDIDLTESERAQAGGDAGVVSELQQAKARDVLGNAVGAGYTLFDTAYEYGTLGALGQALRDSETNPADVFVVYKIKPQEIRDHFDGSVASAVSAARRGLGRGYIDVLMLHDLIATDEELVELASQMKVLVEAGWVRYLGLSNVSAPAQIDMMSRAGNAEIGISFVQNKMHPHRQDTATRAACDARGITYMGYSIMGSGNNTGHCGQVVSSEPAYDVRQDGALGHLADAEEMEGGPSELAIAWAVQEGTVQIPKTTNPRRMVANRRAGTHRVSAETQHAVEAMDDVITDDDQAALLQRLDVPKNQLRMLLHHKSKWHALDRLYAAGLTAALDTIGGAVGADAAAARAFEDFMTYVAMIDGGGCQSVGFIAELGVGIAPGDYSRIVAGLGMGGPVATLKAWWTNADAGGGCPRARSRVMGYIVAGLPANSDHAFDEPVAQPVVAAAAVAIPTIAIRYADLVGLADAVETLAVGESYYATYQGRMSEIEIVTNPGGGNLTVKIMRQM